MACVTTGAGRARPFLAFDDGRTDGAVSADGRIAGAYVHGLLDQASARAVLLGQLGATVARGDHPAEVDKALDELAETLAQALDIDAIARIAGL